MKRHWLTRLPGQHKITAVQAETEGEARDKVQKATGCAQYTTGIHGYEEAPPDVEDYLETEHLLVYFQAPVQGLPGKLTYIRHKVPGGWVYIYLDEESGMTTSVFVPLPVVCYEKL